MTGYQEILTDPSYSGQIVTLTYPHIGNTGVNAEDVEANRVTPPAWLSATVRPACRTSVPRNRCPSTLPSRASSPFPASTPQAYAHPAREGAQGACIFVGTDAERAVELARGFPAWPARTWPASCPSGPRRLDPGHLGTGRRLHRARPVALPRRGLRLRRQEQHPAPAGRSRLPHHAGAGPDHGRRSPQAQSRRRVPVQRPRRPRALRLRHRSHPQVPGPEAARVRHLPGPPDHGPGGGRQDRQDEDRPPRRQPPVQDLASKRVFITSQNHGFAVDAASLPANARTTHVSLFDGTLQGFELTDRPAFCFQGHPEASPARTTSSCCSTSSSA